MHELSIAIRIAEIAAEAARREGKNHVDSVHLEIGELTGVVPGALENAFRMTVKNTGILADASLELSVVSALAKCNACHETFEPDGFTTICPACHAFDCDIIKGKELHIQYLVAR